MRRSCRHSREGGSPASCNDTGSPLGHQSERGRRTKALRRLQVVALVTIGLAGCTYLPFLPSAPADYRYVLIGPDGMPIARAITAGAACPAIDLDGGARPMTVRMAPATISLRPTRSEPALSKPSAFPVLTCELAIPAGTRRAAIGGHPLPLPVADPQRIVVIGDTGCRIKVSDNAYQDCDDPAQWPFARVAAAAAAAKPDLVVHVGDYHYRENACPDGKPGCFGSPWGYGWDAWRADLFHPARDLLAAAPWIVVRGNHESCNRAGQGWWRFLDPRPVAPRQDCNAAADDAIGDYSEPYAVPLTARADAKLIVFDSSAVGVTPLAPTDLMYRNYHGQFLRAFALTAGTPQVIFISHHPPLAFAANPAAPAQPYPGNAGLQSVLQAMYPTILFPPNVTALLAGHNHMFEMVSFSSGQPPQFVSGNAGDWADDPFPVPFPAGLQPAPGAVVADMVASNRFGFMTMERDGARWRIEARDVRGALLTSCALEERRAACAPVAEPWAAQR